MTIMGAFLRSTRCGAVVEVSTLDPGKPCAGCAAQTFSFCRALSHSQLGQLARFTRHVSLRPGQQLVGQGDATEHYYNVVGGHLRAFRELEDGRRQITSFLECGDFIGLSRNDTYDFTIEAIGDVRLCQFPRLALQALVDDFQLLERYLHEQTSNELLAAHDHMVLLGCKTARERVISFLLYRAGPNGASVELPMTQSDIADHLGLRLETVSRVMNALRAEGLIARPGPHKILLLEPAALRAAAG